MRFEHPHLLWFLVLFIPGLIAFFWWSWRRRQELVTQFVAARLLAQLTVGVSAGRQKARLALIVAAVTLLILALARPQLGFTWEEVRSRGLDVVVAIDTSRSMLAADLAPNRLRRAQLAALDLKRLARGDRLGLVAFAGSAFLQCPLTLDDEAFRQSVEALDVSIIPQGGTAVAEAILAAKGAFKEGNDNHKVLVLLTDGEDHDGAALETAKQAGKEGLRIFTIGVGTANGELLRTVDVQGRTEFVKDPDGNAVKSRLNEPLLREMAQQTGGFFMLLSGANTMSLLYERGLAPLPKGEQAAQRLKRYHERYQWLLGLVLTLLLLELLLPERPRAPKRAAAAATSAGISPASPPAAAAPGTAAATPGTAAATPGTAAATPGTAAATPGTAAARAALGLALLLTPTVALPSAGDGLKQYQQGRFERALNEFERALKKKPDDARLQFNAGTAAFQNKDYDQALEHLSSALVTQDLPLQQRSYYNIGNTRFRLGEAASEPEKKTEHWEQAVRSYDSALRLDPKDADAEFNREWVKKQLEELKQQQQQQKQQNQDQDKNKDKDKDDKGDSKKDEQSKQDPQQQPKEQQDKNQEQQDQQKQPKEQKPEEQQDQKQPDQAQSDKNKDKKEGEEKKGQQASPKDDPGQPPEGEEGQPQKGQVMRMTPQQAAQLLETLKGEEKVMMFRPVQRTNRHERVFKDW